MPEKNYREFARIVVNRARPDGTDCIPIEIIDFSRYRKNPVILKAHDWAGAPIGLLTKLDETDFSGVPVFHGQTPESEDIILRLEHNEKIFYFLGGLWKDDFKTFELLEISAFPAPKIYQTECETE